MTYDNNTKALIMLSTVDGYKFRRRRLDAVDSASELYDDYTIADRMIEEMDKLGVKVMTILDDDYPSQLKDIYDPPLTLYYKGDKSLLHKENLLGVVGTRRVSAYGKNIMQNFMPSFLKSGLIVVSGLARGVDSIGHKYCLEAGVPTIGVIANGLDICYPPENDGLQQQMFENGLVISEYPLKSRPIPFHFPERNRIISGLARGVFIPEAGDKSGSLITADYAIEQGKELFVVPGSIFSTASAGCNKKIKELQAIIALTPDDVIEALGYDTHKIERQAVQMSMEEQSLINIMEGGMLHLYAIMEKSGLSIATLAGMLTKLEIMGVIRKLQGNYYEVIPSL